MVMLFSMECYRVAGVAFKSKGLRWGAFSSSVLYDNPTTACSAPPRLSRPALPQPSLLPPHYPADQMWMYAVAAATSIREIKQFQLVYPERKRDLSRVMHTDKLYICSSPG